MEIQPVDHARVTRLVGYAMYLLWLVAITMQFGRLLTTQSATGETPFHSANDRSRWCTVAALAIHGRYEIDDILQIRDPQSNRRTWYTIDLVQHRAADAKQHFYSSKPPLLATLVTGVYMVVRNTTGATLMNDTFFAVRAVLIIVNLLPLAIAWWLCMQWLRRCPLNDWSRLTLFAFVLFGTFLSTFANTFNNHLPAALAIAISLWAVDRILVAGDRRWRWFVISGLATSFAAANELPALSWLAAVAALLTLSDLRKTIFGFGIALLPVTIGFFGTNYLAHGQWSPAYAKRSLGELIVALPLTPTESSTEEIVARVTEELNRRNRDVSKAALVRAARRPGVSELWDPTSQQRFGLQFVAVSEGWQLNVHEWGDWYDYPKSYWTDANKKGVDRGEPNRLKYMLHCLIGHHGILSLTPFWFISLFGAVQIWRYRRGLLPNQDGRLWIAAAIVATSCIAIAFYLARPLEDRNYGGVSSGFRWVFWLTAPWIWLAVAGLQKQPSQATSPVVPWARRLIETMVVVSIFSASFPWANPWTSPWLMQLMEYLGWPV